ncbi:type II secretion system protein [Sulfuricurvum sp. IAE1]|uniref:type IV pilus modification PilV family protein n=1 Tax=Sulfuricurvum sp. IAE1 TaxID=2546102 RepID=UPI0010449FF1|nr:type II secretion system protein [Sulfuricurvum sp. IAE1]MDD3769530.1 type II secretion system protein [Sulfuricurvum sp.]MDX9965376.1 type II secretion system protein [Sulfuricurvum sp.]TDA62798.1 type II secretion system protein [Sulfuricurvum sp. IAE1]
MYVTKRKGFAMIMAIFIVVIIAAGGALMMQNASLGSKAVSSAYLRTQADLLAQSATEYALMRAQGVDTTGGTCLNRLNITVNDASGRAMFDITASLAYSFRGAAPAACDTLAQNTGKETMVLIDVRVDDRNISSEDIRVHKRSWQKL